ncbi:hypothetical protein DFH29DRAFT_880734 [Suillus ampliporus]|nr:hypothetical protein DFH29DRAFT_880734 [Suillus ampliporus]
MGARVNVVEMGLGVNIVETEVVGDAVEWLMKRWLGAVKEWLGAVWKKVGRRQVQAQVSAQTSVNGHKQARIGTNKCVWAQMRVGGYKQLQMWKPSLVFTKGNSIQWDDIVLNQNLDSLYEYTQTSAQTQYQCRFSADAAELGFLNAIDLLESCTVFGIMLVKGPYVPETEEEWRYDTYQIEWEVLAIQVLSGIHNRPLSSTLTSMTQLVRIMSQLNWPIVATQVNGTAQLQAKL